MNGRKTPTTFVGPIRAHKTAPRKTEWKFTLLQSSGSAIELSYPDHVSAKDARGQLLQSPHVWSVASKALFSAVETALGEAWGYTASNGPAEDE